MRGLGTWKPEDKGKKEYSVRERNILRAYNGDERTEVVGKISIPSWRGNFAAGCYCQHLTTIIPDILGEISRGWHMTCYQKWLSERKWILED